MSSFARIWSALSILMILGSFSAFTAEAQDAGSYQLRLDSPGLPMSHVRVRDQVGLGICYAETAAELFDAVRFKQGDPLVQSTSGVFLGVETSAQKIQEKAQAAPVNQVLIQPSPWDGGSICKAFKQAVISGGCDLDPAVEPLLAAPLNRVRGTLLDYFQGDFDRVRAGQFTRAEARSALLDHLNYHGNVDRWIHYDPVDFMEMDQILDHGMSGMSYVLKAIGPQCYRGIDGSEGSRLRLRAPVQCVEEPGFDALRVRNRLQQLLEGQSGGLPIGIGFCSGLFLATSLDYQGLVQVALPDGSLSWQGAENCYPHAVLVIGERVDPRSGRLEFLIRNSWGVSGKSYPDYFGNQYDNYSPIVSPELGTGNVWVDADLLSRNVSGLSIIQGR